MEEQVKKADAPIDALLLVGGFSESHYLFKRDEAQFKGRISVIARPNDADTATSRGAAQVSTVLTFSSWVVVYKVVWWARVQIVAGRRLRARSADPGSHNSS